MAAKSLAESRDIRCFLFVSCDYVVLSHSLALKLIQLFTLHTRVHRESELFFHLTCMNSPILDDAPFV
jgi:hypothetical protein